VILCSPTPLHKLSTGLAPSHFHTAVLFLAALIYSSPYRIFLWHFSQTI